MTGRAAKRHHKYCVKPRKEKWLEGVGSSVMNEIKKKDNNGVAFSVRGPDAFLHRQLAVGSSGQGSVPALQRAARVEAGGGIVPVVNLRPQQTAPHTPASHRLQTNPPLKLQADSRATHWRERPRREWGWLLFLNNIPHLGRREENNTFCTEEMLMTVNLRCRAHPIIPHN